MCLLPLTTLVITCCGNPSTEPIAHRRYDHYDRSNVRNTTSQTALVELIYTTLTLGGRVHVHMRTMDMMQTYVCTVHSHTYTCIYIHVSCIIRR